MQPKCLVLCLLNECADNYWNGDNYENFPIDWTKNLKDTELVQNDVNFAINGIKFDPRQIASLKTPKGTLKCIGI